MKTYKLKTLQVAVAVAIVAGAVAAIAGTVIIGPLVTWTTGTNYSSTVSIGSIPVPGVTLNIQHSGLTDTNNLPIYAQISLGVDASGSTNYLTIAGPWYPSATNAGTYTWWIPTTNITLYGRIKSVQTNSVTLGGSIN